MPFSTRLPFQVGFVKSKVRKLSSICELAELSRSLCPASHLLPLPLLLLKTRESSPCLLGRLLSKPPALRPHTAQLPRAGFLTSLNGQNRPIGLAWVLCPPSYCSKTRLRGDMGLASRGRSLPSPLHLRGPGRAASHPPIASPQHPEVRVDARGR